MYKKGSLGRLLPLLEAEMSKDPLCMVRLDVSGSALCSQVRCEWIRSVYTG